ncbi:MAG TPA: hypothetical protein VHK26_01730 [Methyloceanibacter sp.]|nr:hypothetical protein [Methyloceanibacter sp.]
MRLFDGKLPTKTRRSLNRILDYWEKNHAKDDDRWLAYALGTAHHETDRTFGPIREYGRGRGKKYYPYYGRGLVQLTWERNYRKMSPVVGVDLVKYPDRALDLTNAIPIMFIGMKQGTFTGKKFTDYFNKSKEDWVSTPARSSTHSTRRNSSRAMPRNITGPSATRRKPPPRAACVQARANFLYLMRFGSTASSPSRRFLSSP